MHVLSTICTMSRICFIIPVQLDQRFDEVDRKLGVLRNDAFDGLTDVRARSIERAMQHRIRRRDLRPWSFFQGPEGGGGDQEGAHVVGSVGVGVDVFETVGWSGHVLFGVVVASEVHDYMKRLVRREK